MIKIHQPKKDSDEILEKIKYSINEVIDSGVFLNGSKLKEFESIFSNFIGVKNTIGIGNATDGLEIALLACGITLDDEVLTVANAGGYSTVAILRVGAKPVYCDVNDNLLVDLEDISRKVSHRTKAIVITHLYGNCVDINRVRSIVGNSISIIEDCSHAHGSKFRNRNAGSMGDCGVFSFYPTKTLGSFGSGGAITTNNSYIADCARKLSNYGWGEKYSVDVRYGKNSKLDEFQSSILIIKLSLIDKYISRKRDIYNFYKENCPNIDWINYSENSSIHLCVLKALGRRTLADKLNQSGIETDVHYPIPDYTQNHWQQKGVSLEKTDFYSERILTIPLNYSMTDSEVEYVTTCLRDFGKYS